MTIIRKANSTDLDALYAISLKTGHLGGDATHLYTDPRMIGHIYSAPYLVLEPDLAFVIEHNGQVAGFCVGTADTRRFESRMDAHWWPNLRAQYAKPDMALRSSWSKDDTRAFMIHEPESTPQRVVSNYPAHLHLNLLPELQGKGQGGRLLNHWIHAAMGMGVKRVHVGSNAQNTRANGFWQKQGFKQIPDIQSRTFWMGRALV